MKSLRPIAQAGEASGHPGLPDLASLARAERPEGFLTGFELREYGKGQLLSTPADSCNQVLVVKSGRLRVFLAGENRELSLGFLEPGEVYTTHAPAYVQAVAPTALWVIDTAAFARKLAADPTAVPAMLRVLGRVLNHAVGLIEDLAFREVPDRLARFLLGLAERRGQAQEEGRLIPLDLGMEDIASLLGTTRQTVSALINQWEREGILRRRGRRHLVILAPESLAARCRPPF